MKVLVKKKYGFVELLWAMFVTQNKADLTYVLCISIFDKFQISITGNLMMKMKVVGVMMLVIETSLKMENHYHQSQTQRNVKTSAKGMQAYI